MRRRVVIGFAGTALFAWPLIARAQQQAKIARLGYLGFGTPSTSAPLVEALRAGLRDLGYVEGKNLIIEFRWPGTVEQMHEAAAELVRMKVDIIFAGSSTQSEPARRATSTIPIVFAAHADPVGLGHVSSLARPGGNMTGLAVMVPEITTKQMDLLKATVPQATRFGVLYSPTAPSYRPVLDAAEAVRGKLGVQLRTVGVSTVAEYDGAFATMAQARVGAVLVHSSTLTVRHNPRLLAELALKHRLPTMFTGRENVVAGGLMSYGPDFTDMTRRAAVYIDKILKGVKPADLPVEQASKHLLIINLKTARARPDDPTIDPHARRRGNRVGDERCSDAISDWELSQCLTVWRHARDVLMGDDVLSLPNNMVERTGPGRPAAHHDRWADQSESTMTMTTKGGIVGRGGGLVIWEARL